ncbi:MAG: hypothetical protein ABI867_05045 [Kofleriaceae bacterium]
MKPLVCLCLLAACGDNTTSVSPDAAPPIEPPPPPGIQFFDFAIAVDVSPDGRTAVFEDVSTSIARAYVVDTITGQPDENPVVVGDPGRVIATGVSDNRRLSALHGEPVQAGLWTATEWLDLGSPFAAGCDQDQSGAFDISADGETMVGLAWNGCSPRAFRWTAATGFTTLQQLGTGFDGGAPNNRATVISDDGQVTAGFAQNGAADRSPAIWHADGTGLLLTPDDHETPGEVMAINADGTRVAGMIGLDGFAWSAATGIVMLERFPEALPSDTVFPNTQSGDGEFVFGGVGDIFFTLPTAFVWSARTGMRPVVAVAREAGITISEDTLLFSVLGASADGLVLVGTAMVGRQPKTFVLRLPASAYERS